MRLKVRVEKEYGGGSPEAIKGGPSQLQLKSNPSFVRQPKLGKIKLVLRSK